MKTHRLLLLLVAALPACSLLKKKPDDIAYDKDKQAALAIPSYTREALDGWPEGRKIDPYDSSRVRFPDGIHTYQIGRLPSADRREMHEAHTVYRVEQSARWDQRLPATPMESRGVVLGIREPSSNAVPPDQVVANERSRQLQYSAQIQRQLEEMQAKQKKLDDFLASAPDKTKTIEQLQQAKAKAEQDLANLQALMEALKQELQGYKDREAIQQATMKGSRKNADKKP
jgi:hypothetical protein